MNDEQTAEVISCDLATPPSRETKKRKTGSLKVRLQSGEEVIFEGERLIEMFQFRFKGCETTKLWESAQNNAPKTIVLSRILVAPNWKIKPKEIDDWVAKARLSLRLKKPAD